MSFQEIAAGIGSRTVCRSQKYRCHLAMSPTDVILSGAVLQAKRRISRLSATAREPYGTIRALGRLFNPPSYMRTRASGSTPVDLICGARDSNTSRNTSTSGTLLDLTLTALIHFPCRL